MTTTRLVNASLVAPAEFCWLRQNPEASQPTRVLKNVTTKSHMIFNTRHSAGKHSEKSGSPQDSKWFVNINSSSGTALKGRHAEA